MMLVASRMSPCPIGEPDHRRVDVGVGILPWASTRPRSGTMRRSMARERCHVLDAGHDNEALPAPAFFAHQRDAKAPSSCVSRLVRMGWRRAGGVVMIEIC
jgi:hypothetical protein